MSTNLIALQNKFLGHGQTVYDKLSNLHEQQGYVSDGDITAIAAEFHLPPAHVRSTAKFYEELSHDKAATHVVKVCNGEACRAAGCSGIERQMCDAFSVELGATSGDGVRVESVACLGYCGLGPNVMVDGLPLAMSDGAATDKVVKQVQRDEPHGLTEPTNAVYKPADGAPCVLMRHFDKDIVSFDASCAAGVYSALERAVTSMSPQAVIDQVKEWRRAGHTHSQIIELCLAQEITSRDGRTPSQATISRWTRGVEVKRRSKPSPAAKAPGLFGRQARPRLEDQLVGLLHCIEQGLESGLSHAKITSEVERAGYRTSKGKPIRKSQITAIIARNKKTE